MKSRIWDMLGIEFPLFAFSHCRDVVAAVSRVGGFGVLGACNFTPEQLKVELDWIDAHAGGKPYGIDFAVPENLEDRDAAGQTRRTMMARIPDTHYHFTNDLLARHGVRPLTDDLKGDDELVAIMPDTAEKTMDEAFRHPVRLIVNALGLPPKSMLERARTHGVPVGALVGSRVHARRQIDAGVDVLVAQGTEAAAHCGEVTTMVLVPEVVAEARGSNIPVLAAGGIVTGRQMAAAMMLGA
ncbi:MAG: nitronate monooxygenase, partial [Sphingomonadales bacterium]